ncbi:hypothetical protein EIN_268010 [Entamoeba invadens IP1]|uniref:Uncharacterized protein n=1 Tax=Entamoeba invadens IP1 TaxID=370355 RepID=A0A0A1UE36_ENTIV|nr:hypothetical protein EIN_268010 [Entamoeba invadens IP1]ELP91065.1 hypothetical protein EIN_268010 [Entamoeba invadens IP1]|eukprot:XP_004257836.1 hypothetical protein EIN_268010 [Entamoeba invadens IP1]
METVLKRIRTNPFRVSDKSLYQKRDFSKPTQPTHNKHNTQKSKVYVKKVTDEKKLAEQRKIKKSDSATVKQLSQRRARINKCINVINAEVIGLEQSKGLPAEKLAQVIESDLPQYNLGTFFSSFPEPLANISRKLRHVKIAEDLDERLKTEKSKTVLSAAKKTQKVFYELVDAAAKIGISREPILIALFYNYGLSLLNNMTRRAAKFMNDYKKEGDEFLRNIQKKYEAEKPERDLKIRIKKYNQVDGNVKTVKSIITSLEETITLLKDPKSKISTISPEGNEEFVYDEESIESINNIIKLKMKQIERLQKQNDEFVEHDDELKRLTKYNTLHFVLVLDHKNPHVIDLDMKASYFDRVKKSEEKIKQFAAEKQFVKDVCIPEDIVGRYLPKLNGKVRDRVDDEFIPKVEDVNTKENYTGNKVVSQKALDKAKKNAFEISFTDSFECNLFNRNFRVFGNGLLYKVTMENANYPRRVEKNYGAIVMNHAKQIYAQAHPQNNSYCYHRISSESFVVAVNNITHKMFKTTKQNLIDLARALFEQINNTNIKTKTIYISEYTIVKKVFEDYSYPEILERIGNNTIEPILREEREILYRIEMKEMIERATKKITVNEAIKEQNDYEFDDEDYSFSED